MQNDNKIFEDLSKVATAAMGTLAGATREFSDVRFSLAPNSAALNFLHQT